MKSLPVFNLKGEKRGNISVPDKFLAQKGSITLLKQAVLAYLANQRIPLASTKKRSQVSGGGRKPWKQKGTGRARAGSIRSPIFRGGGVVFGPTKERNYKQRLPQKMNQKATFTAILENIKKNHTIIIDNIKFSKVSTKEAEASLHKLPIEEGTILIILAKQNLPVVLSYRNLPYCKIINLNNINIYDLLKFNWHIWEKEAFKKKIESFDSEKKQIAFFNPQEKKIIKT